MPWRRASRNVMAAARETEQVENDAGRDGGGVKKSVLVVTAPGLAVSAANGFIGDPTRNC
jgi:hypothetical protein